ncbi:hypothetical protein [Agrococcus citreus]
MSDGTEQSGADAVRTGEVRVPEGAGAVLPSDMGGQTGEGATLGAAEWPAGEADEPQGQAEVRESQASGAGTASAEEERLRAERESDDGELTPSDPSLDPGMPPANLAEPLR